MRIEHSNRTLAADCVDIEADVVVLGAGLSGLLAAREMKRAGLEVAVLEARDRVGGRLLSAELGEDRVIDLGGAYFGPAGYLIEELSRELGVKSYRTYDEGHSQIDTGRRIARYRGFIPRLGLLTLFDSLQALRRLERLGTKVPLGEPWTARRAAQWDSQTFWSWTRRNMVTSKGRRLMNLASEGMLGASAGEVSLLHALSYSNSNGGFQYVLAVRDGSQQRRFVGGAQSLCLALAAEVENQLHLGRAAQRVVHRADRVLIEGPGFTASARHAVMALPVPLAGRLVYEPALANRRDQLAQRMTPGSTIKCFAIYDTPFWRTQGLNGQAASIDADAVARAVLDATPPQGDPGVLEVFVVGQAARRVATLSESDRRSLVLAELSGFFGPEALAPRGFLIQNWIEEPFTRGCYHAFAQCGVYRAFGPALRESIGPLHWAGAESGAHAMGSMGGAVEAGLRAAAEVVAVESGDSAEGQDIVSGDSVPSLSKPQFSNASQRRSLG